MKHKVLNTIPAYLCYYTWLDVRQDVIHVVDKPVMATVYDNIYLQVKENSVYSSHICDQLEENTK